MPFDPGSWPRALRYHGQRCPRDRIQQRPAARRHRSHPAPGRPREPARRCALVASPAPPTDPRPSCRRVCRAEQASLANPTCFNSLVKALSAKARGTRRIKLGPSLPARAGSRPHAHGGEIATSRASLPAHRVDREARRSLPQLLAEVRAQRPPVRLDPGLRQTATPPTAPHAVPARRSQGRVQRLAQSRWNARSFDLGFLRHCFPLPGAPCSRLPVWPNTTTAARTFLKLGTRSKRTRATGRNPLGNAIPVADGIGHGCGSTD